MRLDLCREMCEAPAKPRDTWCIAQARKLETEVDVRLAAFGKLCAGFDTTYGTRGEAGLATDQVGARKCSAGQRFQQQGSMCT